MSCELFTFSWVGIRSPQADRHDSDGSLVVVCQYCRCFLSLLWSAAQQRERHSEPGWPVSLCGTLTSAGSLRRCSAAAATAAAATWTRQGRASWTSGSLQRPLWGPGPRPPAGRRCSPGNPTPRTSTWERGEKRKTTVRSLLLLLACLLSIYLCIYYYIITCMWCIYLFFYLLRSR